MRSIRLRLIAILVATVLVPAIPATLTVYALFHRSLEVGAEEALARGARAGLAATRALLEEEKARFAARLRSGAPVDTLTAPEFAALVDRDRGTLRAMAERAPRADRPDARGAGAEPRPSLAGPERVELGGRDVLVALVPAGPGPVWVVQAIPDSLLLRAQDLTVAIRLVETLRRERDALARGLVATFVAVYGVVLLLVVILGALLAARLTRPLEALAEGIDRVAGGDLGARVSGGGEPGVALLIERFNAMAERLERQRDELIRLEKIAAWRSVARRLAHEVKNPLTPIRLAVNQMRDAWRGDDPAYRAVLHDGTEIVEEEIGKLLALTRGFSDFARLPSPEPRAVEVRALLEEAAALYGEARVHVSLADDAELPRAWCDPGEVHRVLVNLVNNALEAAGDPRAARPGAPSPAPVELAAEALPDAVAVEVRDRGPGVPAADRRRVFAPDYSTRSAGMGLGLAIVDEIVRAHGGSVEVLDREGGGAVFRFTLPRAERFMKDGA